MVYYSIYFTFRGRERTAHVHAHEGYWLVSISDEELLRDFGGETRFLPDGSAQFFRQAADAKDLQKAIWKALRR